jgi:hypothetical protein
MREREGERERERKGPGKRCALQGQVPSDILPPNSHSPTPPPKVSTTSQHPINYKSMSGLVHSCQTTSGSTHFWKAPPLKTVALRTKSSIHELLGDI